MNIILKPTTPKGKWALGLFLLFLVAGGAASLLSSLLGSNQEYPTLQSDPLLAAAIYMSFAAAIVAALLGILAVWREKERSLLVYLSIPMGLFLLLGLLIFGTALLFGPPAP
mgnify:CR=1 FL=1